MLFLCFFKLKSKKNTLIPLIPKVRRINRTKIVLKKASEKSCPMKLGVLSQKRSSKVYEWRASKLAAVVCSTPLTWVASHGSHGFQHRMFMHTCTVLATCFFERKNCYHPQIPQNSIFNQLFCHCKHWHTLNLPQVAKLFQKSARCLSLPPTKSLKPRFPGKWTWGSQAVRSVPWGWWDPAYSRWAFLNPTTGF